MTLGKDRFDNLDALKALETYASDRLREDAKTPLNDHIAEQELIRDLVEAAQLAWDFAELDTMAFVARWGHNITSGEKSRRLEAALGRAKEAGF